LNLFAELRNWQMSIPVAAKIFAANREKRLRF
jgi:hypothetical protein